MTVSIKKQPILFQISGFRRCVFQAFALLGCSTAYEYGGWYLQTFWVQWKTHKSAGLNQFYCLEDDKNI